MDTPIALIAYKRPDTTRQVLDKIRDLAPKRLFLICDGPKSNEDEPGVREVRSLLETVDWECEVTRIFADNNMGLRPRIESGLTEVFSMVDRAIILEDDCVPSERFAAYCARTLELYQGDPRVGLVSGDNAHGYFKPGEDHYFSRFTLIWGWATWARAWEKYDLGQSLWPDARDSGFLHWFFKSKRAAAYWNTVLESNYNGGNSWARVWMLTCWLNSMLCAIASKNLISNIGFDDDATHTRGKNDLRGHALYHDAWGVRGEAAPAQVRADDDADALIDKIVFARDPVIFLGLEQAGDFGLHSRNLHEAFHADGYSIIDTNQVLAAYWRMKQSGAPTPALVDSQARARFAERVANGPDAGAARVA